MTKLLKTHQLKCVIEELKQQKQEINNELKHKKNDYVASTLIERNGGTTQLLKNIYFRHMMAGEWALVIEPEYDGENIEIILDRCDWVTISNILIRLFENLPDDFK
jgi:hypothetical protein